MSDPFQLARFPRRLQDAGRGLIVLLRTCPNARIHLVATLIAIALGLWLRIGISAWLWIVFAIGLVWIAEGFNSALEQLADRVSREHDPLIARTKDMAAGAVLVAAITAATIGGLVFIPRLIALY